MSLRDFGIFVFVCFLWALNTVLSKIVIAHFGVPPLFYGAARFLVVAIATLPWLLPAPKPTWRMIVIGLCMGGGAFALSFIGLKTASPSATAIVGQLGMPLTTVLSVLILGETIHWRRGLGIVLAAAGILTVMWRPNDFEASRGLLWVVASTVATSIGAVMMKQVKGVRPLQFQAWVGLSSMIPLLILSPVLEPDGMKIAIAAGLPFLGAVLFSALVVSVVGHTLYYRMIQRYEANLVSPLTILTPLFTVLLGVVITHDAIDTQMAIGSGIALTGIFIIALRRNHVAPLLTLIGLRA